MDLTLSSAVAQRHGIHGATVLAYLQYCHDHDHDTEGRFTAPQFDLRVAFRIVKGTFVRARNELERDGLITVDVQPNTTIYTLNHQAIAALTGDKR